MFRFQVAAAAAAATLALVPGAGVAQARDYYSATLEAPAAKASLVTRSTVWKCAGNVCTAAKANARDAIVCELVARENGRVTAFRADEADFDADALAKCNAKAK